MTENDSWIGKEGGSPALDMVILPRTSEIAEGFRVRRALPSSRRRMVGPFIFLDQMGPEVLTAGRGMDIAPHPHIGLATLTYLFEGEALHRDSLGVTQRIRPGDVNWMMAGRGIAHSERSPEEIRRAGTRLFGLQSWVALPMRYEDADPTFAHHEVGALPMMEEKGVHLRLAAGTLFGARAPVETLSEMFYADVTLDGGARIPIPVEHEERAVYIVQGSVELDRDGGTFGEGQLLVLKPGEPLVVQATAEMPARMMLLGGAAMDGPRHIWWNFVSSSRERIEQAKTDWREGRFAPVPDETEFIPLPEDKPIIARYP